MITVDKEQGMASDHGEIWKEDAGVGIRTVVDMSLEDDGQFCFKYVEEGKDINIYVPVERLRALLKG